MEMKLKRFEFGKTFTIGKLYIDGIYQCFVLEDVVRPKEEKVHGQTAIPSGTYSVIIDRSTRFNKDMPHILNVPNFTGVRIHSGNSSTNTEGCLLVGTTWSKGDFIGNSKLAYNALFKKLIATNEKITITIE